MKILILNAIIFGSLQVLAQTPATPETPPIEAPATIPTPTVTCTTEQVMSENGVCVPKQEAMAVTPTGNPVQSGMTGMIQDSPMYPQQPCGLEKFTEAAQINEVQVPATKQRCEADGLSDTDTAAEMRGYKLTWGGGAYSSDILPLNVKSSVGIANSIELSYYKAGHHDPKMTQVYPADAQRCDTTSVNGTAKEYVCPRKRTFYCDKGQMMLRDPKGNGWPVEMTPLTAEEVSSKMAKDNVAPTVDSGMSASCYICGQIPPFSNVPWLAPATSPTAPATPAAGEGTTPASSVTP